MGTGVKIAIALGVILVLGLVAWGGYNWYKNKKDEQMAQETAANQVEKSFAEGTKASVPKDATLVDAVYGTNEKNIDVAAVVKTLIANSSDGSFDVSNTTMGSDPDVGKAKKLTLHYLPKKA